VIIFTDHQGKTVRLTEERHAHILEHPEMAGQMHRLGETLSKPELIVMTTVDEIVWVYLQ
jgi:hypothetical protein